MADDGEREFEDQLVSVAEGLEIPSTYAAGDDFDDEFGKDDEVYEPLPEVSVPDPVRHFLLQFARHVQEKSVYELHYFYDNSFNKLTEKFYAKTAWPEPETVAALVGDGGRILIDVDRMGLRAEVDRCHRPGFRHPLPRALLPAHLRQDAAQYR